METIKLCDLAMMPEESMAIFPDGKPDWFRTIAESMGCAFFRMRTGEVGFDFVSESIVSVCGFSSAEIASEGFSGILIQSSLPGRNFDIFDIDAVVPEGEFEWDALIKAKNGELRWVNVHRNTWTDDLGRDLGWQGILRDVSERKRSEMHALQFAEFSERLNYATSPLDAARVMAEVSEDMIGGESFVLCWYTEQDQTLIPALGRDINDGELATFPLKRSENRLSQFAKKILESGSAVVCAAVGEALPELDSAFANFGTKAVSSITVRLRTGKRTIGVMSLRSYSENAYDQESLSKFQALADYCSSSVERILTQEALKDSEERFRIICENVDDLIAVVDREGKRIYNSPSYQRLFQQDALARKMDSLNPIHPEDRQRVREILDTTVSSKIGQRADYRFLLSDGRVRFIESQGSVTLDRSGEVEKVIVVSRDVTEQRETQIRLRESEERFRSLIESASDVILVLDTDGVVKYCSPSIIRVLGLDPENLVGRHFANIVPEEDFQIFAKAHGDCFAFPGTPMPAVEYRVLRANGYTCEAEVTITNLMDNSAIGGVIYNLRDITERKGFEERILKLNWQLERRIERIAAQRKVDQATNASLDLRLTLSIVAEQAIKEQSVSAVCIRLLNPFSQRLESAVQEGFERSLISQNEIMLGTGMVGMAALERRPLSIRNINDLDTSSSHGLLVGQGYLGYHGVPLIAKGKLHGYLEAYFAEELPRDGDAVEFLDILAVQTAIAIENSMLLESLHRSNAELALAYDRTLEGWVKGVDLRDKDTEGHTQRVTELTLRLASQMGYSEAELVHVRRGALLHDIGKIGVPDAILNKPGPLTADERKKMEDHAQFAYDMLSPIAFLKPALDIPYCHHEKWDGTGYPRRLAGEQIPPTARIFAVIDVFDALTSERPYKHAWPVQKALDHIQSQSGKHFDPAVVDQFMLLMEN